MKVSRSVRALRSLAAAALLAALVAPPARAADPPVVDQTGWWSETSVTLLPGVTPATPAPPNVPPGSIGVSALAGDTISIAAVGITLGAEPGTIVNRLTLQMRPAEGDGTDSTTPVTGIRACVITAFWGGVDYGSMDLAPEFDCNKGAAQGVRAEDATWTFDLTSMAAQWLNPDGGLSPNGVVLVPSPEPPGQTFSIAYATGSGIVLTFDAVEPPPSFDDSSSDGFDGSSDSFDPGSSGGFADLPPSSDGSFGGPGEPSPTTAVTSAPAPPPGDPEPAVETSAAPTQRVPAEGPGTFGGWPLGVYLAGLLALALAGLASLTLGVAPVAGRERREGGLSRALAARPHLQENR